MRKKFRGFVQSLFSLVVFFTAGVAVALTVDAVQASAAIDDWAPVTTKTIEPYWEVDYSGRQIAAKNLKNTFTVGVTRTVQYSAPEPVGLKWERETEPGELFWDEVMGEYRIGIR